MYCYILAAPRLACVRPVASVHPEPGSNSSLYILFFLFFNLYERSLSYSLARFKLTWLVLTFFIYPLRYIPFCTYCLSFIFPMISCFALGTFPVCGCKGTAFFFTTKLFSIFFSRNFQRIYYIPHFQHIAKQTFFTPKLNFLSTYTQNRNFDSPSDSYFISKENDFAWIFIVNGCTLQTKIRKMKRQNDYNCAIIPHQPQLLLALSRK